MVKYMNSGSYKVTGADEKENLLEVLLSDIKPELRVSLLADQQHQRMTVLHEACRLEDTETVKVIMNSVTDPQQRKPCYLSRNVKLKIPLYTLSYLIWRH